MTDQSDQSMKHDPSLGLRLDPSSDTPLYQQISDQLARLIARGELGAGTRLPPTRTLARALATHRNTVVRAFEELQARGFLAGHVGRGSYVLGDHPALAPDAPTEPTPSPAASAVPEAQPWSALLGRAVQSEPLRRTQRLGATPLPGSINLARMQPSADLIPHEDFRSCVDHVLATLGPEAMSYAPSQGLERLRALIARELAPAGILVGPDDILITSGSQQAIDLIARTLVNPREDAFLTEGPTYSGALNILATNGADVIEVPGDRDGPELELLDALTTRTRRTQPIKGFYLMPNSRNPTGTSIAPARREGLVEWSRRAEIPLVEDDYGADLELDVDAPRPLALRALDPEVLHLGTFSKKLMPALRVGFIVCPPAMRAPLTSLKHAMDLGTSALLQHGLAEFLDRGLMRTHLTRIRAAYRERRDALVEALHEHLPREVTFDVPERGVVLWLSLPPGADPEAVFQVARVAGVQVSPSTVFAASAQAPDAASGGLRLIYCNEPPERLREGAKRLGRALSSVIGKRGQRRVEHELLGV